MTADITGHTTPRPSGIKSNEIDKRLKKLEDQIACLRKQVLDLEGKKSYTEQAREYANIRSTDNDQSK